MKYLLLLLPAMCFCEVEDDIREYCLASKANCQRIMIETQYMSNFYRALGAHEAYQGIIDYLDED